MDFKEYVQANWKRLDGQTREFVEDAFKAGQQSKQAEIDALKAELAKHDTLDLEPADIPHGTIVLEK